MSLVRIALRIAAIEAIKGRTIVGANVLDSPNGALDISADGEISSDEKRPFVSVFTDGGVSEDITGRSLVENGMCSLVIEAGVSFAMTETDPDTGASTITGMGIPASDSTLEFFLDIVQRQVRDALSDPDNEWAEIFRDLHNSVSKIEIGGRRNVGDGDRLAGQQTVITVSLIDDPVIGQPLASGSPLARFFAKLSTSDDPNQQAQAQTMLTLLGGAAPDWKVLQRKHGLTASELLALGQGPLARDLERATPVMTTGTLEVARGDTEVVQ